MRFSTTILGCSSAIPALGRHLSAQLVNHDERLFLLDCGEGTQLQLRKYKIRFQKISHIFISHLHGDHYFGVIGLLSTLHLLGRELPMHVYAIEELQPILEMQFRASGTKLTYPLIFHALKKEGYETIYEDDKLTVSTVPVSHRIPTFGFIFQGKKQQRKIKKESIAELNISLEDIVKIKQGEDYRDKNGVLHENKSLTMDPMPPKKFSYIPDTNYQESVIPHIKKSDLLYHEATFLKDRQKDATEKFHSTTTDAATIAKKAQVKKLIVGHYSARYANLQPVLNECRSIFAPTELSIEGKEFNI